MGTCGPIGGNGVSLSDCALHLGECYELLNRTGGLWPSASKSSRFEAGAVAIDVGVEVLGGPVVERVGVPGVEAADFVERGAARRQMAARGGPILNRSVL